MTSLEGRGAKKHEGGLKIEIAEALAKYELRTGRGHGLLSMVTDMGRDMLQGGVYLFALRELGRIMPFQWITDIILWIPPLVIIPIVLGKKIFEYYLGWKDEKVGFWKFTNDYLSRKINPFNIELLDTVKRIEEKIEKK